MAAQSGPHVYGRVYGVTRMRPVFGQASLPKGSYRTSNRPPLGHTPSGFRSTVAPYAMGQALHYGSHVHAQGSARAHHFDGKLRDT